MEPKFECAFILPWLVNGCSFSVHQATAEANNLAAVAAAKDQYYKNMEKVSSWKLMFVSYVTSIAW